MRKNGNVVLIAPREELALKEKQQLEAQKDISELEPLVSESFQLNYIKAQDLLNLITTNRQQQFGAGAGQTATTGGQGSFISKRGVAMVDPRSNILFVQDIAVQPRGDPQDHPPDRHADPPGGDRGAHRDRERQVRPAARRALRRADRIPRSTTGTRWARAAACSTQPVVTCRAATAVHARHADADAVRARVGHRLRRLLRFAAAQRQPAGAERRRQSRAHADQPRQRQPHQPRALGARIRQSRQGGVEPARGHRRQPEGAHRAGHGNPVRHARQREQSGHRAVQEGGAEPRRDAADHAGQPDHHDRRGAQGLGRPDGAAWAAASRCRRSTRAT